MEFGKQRIHKEFEDFHKVMKKKKSILLSSIEQLDKEVTKECEYYYDVTQGQLNSLKNLKDSLKAKQQMPPRQLLQVSCSGGGITAKQSSRLVSGQHTCAWQNPQHYL